LLHIPTIIVMIKKTFDKTKNPHSIDFQKNMGQFTKKKILHNQLDIHKKKEIYYNRLILEN